MVVPKEDRRIAILEFLEETGMSLSPSGIYINMGPTFSERTTKRLLYELLDEGLVETLDRPGRYYRITDAGREYLDDAETPD